MFNVLKNWKKLKLLANLHDEEEYVMCIRNLRQALTHRLVSKKVHGENTVGN